MSEKALADVYELRHLARTHHHTLCGAEGLATTCPHHVTCRACLAAYGPVRHERRYVVSDPDRGPDTLGACAIRELAELRGLIKQLADDFDSSGPGGPTWAQAADYMRYLLDPPSE